MAEPSTPPGACSTLRRDAQENLDRLLETAGRVFASEGLGITQAELAERAGVGVATIYRRFASKDELIHEVYRPRLRRAVELAEKAVDEEDAWNGLRGFLEAASHDFAADRGYREFVLDAHSETLGWSRGGPSPLLATLVLETDRAMGRALGALLRRAKAEGALRPEIEVTDVPVILGAIQTGAAMGGAEHPELYRRVLGLVLDGLRAEAAVDPLPVPALRPEQLARATGHQGAHRTASGATRL